MLQETKIFLNRFKKRMKKVDNIDQNVKNPHFVKNPGESAGFLKKKKKTRPGRAFSKFCRVLRTLAFSLSATKDDPKVYAPVPLLSCTQLWKASTLLGEYGKLYVTRLTWNR